MKMISFDASKDDIELARKILSEGKFVEGKYENGHPYEEGDDLVTFSCAVELGNEKTFTLDVNVRNPDRNEVPYIDVECFGPQGDLIGSEGQCELFDCYEMNGHTIILDESKFIELEAFDIARLGEDALYKAVEEKTGIKNIQKMNLKPVAIGDDDYVIYHIEQIYTI